MSHTPTPWKVSPGHAEGAVTIRQDGGEFQRPVAEIWHNGDDPKENAAFIVKAVNSHDKLVEALKAVRAECMGYVPQCADLIDAALEGL